MGTLKIMLMAGEASGDLHGANLAKKIKAIHPESAVFGMGGRLMEDAGVELLYNPTQMSTIGFVEALKSVQVLRRMLTRLSDLMEERKPDVVVLIDFPGFNMRFGELAKRKGIPIVYYFSPAAWAWGKGRAEKVAGFATKVASVFPFEYEVYQQAGANVEFVGHPLLDIVGTTKSRDEICSLAGFETDKPIIGLLPGSRKQEIRTLFPVMVGAARKLMDSIPGVQFLVPMAHTISEELLEEMDLSDLPLKTLASETYNVMASCDLAVIACGTATLEAALLDTPQIALYKISSSTYAIARRLVKISHFALPNIVMGREVVPELIQADATPDKLAHTVMELWNRPDRLAKMKHEFQELKTKLGEPGAVGRVAQMVVEVAEQHEAS